ncbi:post-GPI attachment to proteins factor 6 isoform X1 [Ostrinia furnacalis]|uniref:post-GPI attachment to proteins factor 6 isoform X1 n=1 Tax=Ostrinia furnacalis TaxID=93504 RepID=UPI00103B81E9|nr:post-GPI attachment to proteins factor 6 isoform X1 [Ostrinia furnacalis]
MRIYYVLLYVCVVSAGEEPEEEVHRRKIIEQLTRTRTVLLDDYHLVTRQVATDVYMYRSYRTVSVVFYPVMRGVTDARFTFQSEEMHLNNIGSCSPQEVIVNIKHGSYPAVNPDGYDFPPFFVDPATRENIHTLELLSDGLNRTYSITNPRPGNWYALVYIKWEDPRTQKVEQQGLVADCQTILYTDLQVKREDSIELIDCHDNLTLDYSEIPIYFKCITADSPLPLRLNVTVLNTPEDNKQVTFKVQALSLPTEESNLVHCAFDSKESKVQTISFTPHPVAWHYIRIELIDNASRVADCESYYMRTDLEEIDNNTIFDLMRDDKGRFFTFNYGLPTTDLQDATSLINVTAGEIKSVRFKVNQFLDIGGSLQIEASLLMSLKYYMGYKREVHKGSLLAFTEDNQFIRAVICMDIGHPSIPLDTGHCKYNDQVKPALFILNSTDSETIYDKIIIPFPDSGTWYLTLRIFCDQVVCPCPTSDNGTKYYVSDSLDEEEVVDDSIASWDNTRQGTSDCNTTIVLSVSSTSCVSGRCSNHGSCLLNTFGGLVMSFCSCSAGYGNWDCSDDSRMDSRVYMLVSVLLLTLSNLLFFFSIYVAVIRLYYTEAMMYTFTMLFSTFYHACDAPAQVAYCIVRGNILQFGDFYCGLMSFWVTLLAMSIVGDKFRSTFQLIGAIVIALLTTWNMHSFFSFVFPVAVGCVVLFLSWYLDYRKNGIMKYPKSYYTIYMPMGIVLVTVGLVCYGFLQTEQNYKIVHSVWHMIIALSVVFLLPDVKRTEDTNPFVPSPNSCRLPFCRVFHRSQGIGAN